ncbi:MAG: component of SufBCD complex [Proteobacteria bacterium]|nr:component of SufBCD complex [Pseudomonadota bacterium]MBS0571893.1 component of SufBCD complex [Pseudomonadota bacterium]
MTFAHLFLSLLDLRSFASIWYWLALAVLWTVLAHWVMGAPFDMVARARRLGGQDMRDLEDCVRVARTRLARLGGGAGLVLTALGACAGTVLALLGFVYRVEFCQALFLLVLPLPLVLWLRIALARRIGREGLAGEALCHRLAMHRIAVQAIGAAAILVTGAWGTFQNLMAGY